MAINIYISGSSGFVGSNLLEYLQTDVDLKLHIISRNDLKEPEKINFIDDSIIIHLAGKAHDLKNVADPLEYNKVNFEYTKNLYDAFLGSNANKFIFMSSVKAAADSFTGMMEENITPDPKTVYGKSKLLAEKYIVNNQSANNKSYFILRPCMIHGPGNKGNLNLLYKFVKKGLPYPLAGFHNKRSFLSVENLCFIIREIIHSDSINSGVYNIADDEPISTNDVVRIISDTLKKKPKLWNISPSLIKIIAKTGDILNLPLTTDKLNKLTESFVVSNKKMMSAIKKELPRSSKEGLKITINSFVGMNSDL